VGAAFGDAIAQIHHIGSTSVPGLSAKPTIDLMGVADDLAAIAACDPALEALGYVARGASGITGRLFYRKDQGGRRTHHLHVFAHGSDHIRRHIGFRNFMAANPKSREAYGTLKERLARKFPTDIHSYMDGKDAFIRDIDQQVARSIEVWPERWREL